MLLLGGGGGGAFLVPTPTPVFNDVVLRPILPKLVAGDALRSADDGLPLPLAVSYPSSANTLAFCVWMRLTGRKPDLAAPMFAVAYVGVHEPESRGAGDIPC